MPEMTLVEAVNDALHTKMGEDDRVVVMGEDVGVNGGVFRATEGLHDNYGEQRVIDTPLAEAGIVGTAMGMALYGLRPVPEIQFLDFIYPGFDQIVNEVAKVRYRSGGQYTAPMVIRTPYGGGIRGGHYHSQSSEAYFTHTPGLKVVIPSTPTDTKGLLISAIEDDDPVMFLEPKRMYRAVKEDVDEGHYTEAIGEARVAKEGEDVTLIAYGAMHHVAMEAAQQAEEEGVSAEVVDLRTLVPFDRDTLEESLSKTGRAVIVQEAPRTAGFGAELSAFLHEEMILHLIAPIQRVTGLDTPFPYTLEDEYMPTPNRVLDAIDETMTY
jgi:2-oxoisovalerate dehydrogenase E1 component beta subunit